MKLYNTATKLCTDLQLEPEIRMYCCGITPYDAAHLGHIFTFMTYDLIKRRLEDQGLAVQLVRNITDVDEPIFKKAADIGEDYRVLAERESTDFQTVLRRLNFRPAFAEPKASEYIQQMAEAVHSMLKSDHAYRLENDIYFDITKAESFGSFSGFSEQLLLAFTKRRGGDPQRHGKRQPLDFLLWRGIADPADSAAWDSPIGRGRPGWHIECSVMADTLLGTPFDIHGGGSDLIYPHHECEIAQSKALGQAELARYWVHVAPISYLGEKMSKSLGNLVFAKDLLHHYSPAAIRLSLLRYHYRTGGEWRPEFLDEAEQLIEGLQSIAPYVEQSDATVLLEEIRAALDDDLDSHQILHLLSDQVCAVRQRQSDHPDSHRGEASLPINAAGSGTYFQALELLGLYINQD